MCIACELERICPYKQTVICKLKELKELSHEDFYKMVFMKNYFNCIEQLKMININLIMNYKVNRIYMNLKYDKKNEIDFSVMKD